MMILRISYIIVSSKFNINVLRMKMLILTWFAKGRIIRSITYWSMTGIKLCHHIRICVLNKVVKATIDLNHSDGAVGPFLFYQKFYVKSEVF